MVSRKKKIVPHTLYKKALCSVSFSHLAINISETFTVCKHMFCYLLSLSVSWQAEDGRRTLKPDTVYISA